MSIRARLRARIVAMNDTMKSRARVHRNGMVALVCESPFGNGRYIAGATPAGGTHSIGEVVGTLSGAQQYADGEAKCPQPCTCPGWSHS